MTREHEVYAGYDDLFKPRSKVGVKEQRVAKTVLRYLMRDDCSKVISRDKDFISSLGERARLSAKQIDYVIGDDEGMNPHGLPSLRMKYQDVLRSIAEKERSERKGTFHKNSLPEVKVIYDELNKAWDEAGGDYNAFISMPSVAEKREQYLRLTAPQNDKIKKSAFAR